MIIAISGCLRRQDGDVVQNGVILQESQLIKLVSFIEYGLEGKNRGQLDMAFLSLLVKYIIDLHTKLEKHCFIVLHRFSIHLNRFWFVTFKLEFDPVFLGREI